MAPVAPSPAVLLAGVLAFTLVVGLLGLVRIRKDRPSLKSYEMPVGSMGSDSARTLAAAKTDAETVSARDTPAGSHMRARDQDMTEEEASAGGTMLQRLGAMLWQLTGIPLLTGDATPAAAANPPIESIDSAAMGNTAAPTRTLLSTATTPEIDAVRAHKAPAAASPVVWSEEEEQDDEEATQQARSSDEEDYSDGDSDDDMSSQQTNDETFEQMRAHMVIDGLQFYSAVASVSVATVAHAVDIALFRATTIVMRERRKAHEDASILAIETLYPDIMCLPPGANVRYAGIKSVADATQSVARAMAPATTARHLETGFLKAA